MASKNNDLSSQKKKSKPFPSELKKTTTLSHGDVKFQNTTQSKGSETIKETCFTMCSICLDPIVYASDDHDGQDSVYCEGLCDGWIHRRCAGLFVSTFNQLQLIPTRSQLLSTVPTAGYFNCQMKLLS